MWQLLCNRRSGIRRGRARQQESTGSLMGCWWRHFSRLQRPTTPINGIESASKVGLRLRLELGLGPASFFYCSSSSLYLCHILRLLKIFKYCNFWNSATRVARGTANLSRIDDWFSYAANLVRELWKLMLLIVLLLRWKSF